MATPNPANLKLRAGLETFRGSGRASTWHDFRVSSETLGGEFPRIDDPDILGDGEAPAGLPTKIDPSGELSFAWGPEESEIFLAGFFGASSARTQSPAGVYTTLYATQQTTTTYDTLAVEADRDLSRPDLYLSALVTQLTFQTSPRNTLTGAATLVVPRFGHQAEAVQTQGSSTLPIVRGLGDSSILATPDDTYIQVFDAAPGDGSDFHIKVKRGAASTYDGAAIPVFLGQWIQITDETDTAIGLDGAEYEVYWADATGITSAPTPDEFRINDIRAAWVRVLPTRVLLNEIRTTILVDGVKFRTRDISVTATRPAALDEAVGGRFVDDILERGDRVTSGQLNRAVLDTTVQNRILASASFSLRVDALGTLIGATGVRRRLSLVMPNCEPAGRTASVSGRDTFDEPLSFTAHPSTDPTYPSAITAEVVNSVAAI